MPSPPLPSASRADPGRVGRADTADVLPPAEPPRVDCAPPTCPNCGAVLAPPPPPPAVVVEVHTAVIVEPVVEAPPAADVLFVDEPAAPAAPPVADVLVIEVPALDVSPPVVHGDRADGDGPLVTRYDRGELRASVTTAEGFLLCEGFIARPGVLEYRHADGSLTRELIPPEELHRTHSLASLGRKPTTLEHPPEDVTPDNVGLYGVGDVDGDVEVVEGGFVRVRMAIRRVDAIRAIYRGTVELSPGYSCRIDATPGTHPVYGAYDAIQRDRRYNHVAVTDTARGGPAIRLRADSATQIEANMHPKLIALFARLKVERRTDEGEGLDEAMAKVAEMQAGLAESMPAVASLADLKAKIAVLEAELAGAKATLSAVEAAKAAAPPPPPPPEVDIPAVIEDAMEGDPAQPPAQPPEGVSPPAIPLDLVKIDSIRQTVRRVGEERARLEVLARSLRIDAAVIAKLGNGALRKMVVTTANPAARKDGGADYYRAAADMLGAPRRDVADPAPADPYAGLTEEFRRNTDPARRDAAQPDVAQSFTDTINKGFKQRFHGAA